MRYLENLEGFLNAGGYIENDGKYWCLYDEYGTVFASGVTLDDAIEDLEIKVAA